MSEREGPTHHHGLDTAVVYISRHIEERIRLRDLSAAAGVSIRTLGYLFLQAYGTTPMAFVKQQRLNSLLVAKPIAKLSKRKNKNKARRLLEQANPSTATVGGIARRCGFTHMGQFSLDYKRSMGELPSDTLHRTLRRSSKARSREGWMEPL